ncbi:hypothetical protein M569_12713, partial [Genlisea aurea]
KHFPLTPFRIFRGVLCLVIYLSTAFMLLTYLAPVALLLRLLSVHYSRKFVSSLFGLWLGLWPVLFEKINKTRVIFSGDRIPVEKRVLVMSNHRTEVDWMYLWNLALRKGCLGHIKYVLKSSLMKLPLFGWGFHVLEFIPVARKWEVDESTMTRILSTFADRRDPLWLVVFPEGTDYTDQKCLRSQSFAKENGLPVLKNVLLPKSRGFYCCLKNLRGSLDAVYDVTIAYKHRCPSFMDNVFGVDPSEVHMHVRRIPLDGIPSPEGEVSSWLTREFLSKDQLLNDFAVEGRFPSDHGGTTTAGEEEGELPAAECAARCAAVIGITCMFAWLTLHAWVWSRVYVGLSCAYLACSTYLS